MDCTTHHMSHMVTSQEKQQQLSSPLPVQNGTSPVLAAVPQGWTPPLHVPEAPPRRDVHPQLSQTINAGQQEYHQPAGPLLSHQAPVPSLLYPADSPLPWSSKFTMGTTSSISVPCAQCHVDAPPLNTLCTPYTMPGGVLPPSPTYPCISCNPTSRYDQQFATQHMIQAVSSDENKGMIDLLVLYIYIFCYFRSLPHYILINVKMTMAQVLAHPVNYI